MIRGFIIRQLISFLKENNCFIEFKENYVKRWHDLTFEEFCYDSPIRCVICDAFFWRDTSQGYEYWNIIYYKWIDYCDKYGY